MKQTQPGTDSARELRNRIGDDATATFENDPNFVDSNPTIHASTESISVQRDTDKEIEKDEGEDDDEGDVAPGVDEDDLNNDPDDDMDTDQVAALAATH